MMRRIPENDVSVECTMVGSSNSAKVRIMVSVSFLNYPTAHVIHYSTPQVAHGEF